MGWLRRHGLLLRFAVSVVMLGVLIWRIDVGEALRAIPQVNLRWVAVGLAVFTVSTVVQGFRWWLILTHHARLPVVPVVQAYLVSRFVNVVVPFRGGDVARMQIISHRFHDLPRAEVAGTIFAVETPVNWVTALLLFSVALLFVDVPLIPQVPLLIVVVSVVVGFGLLVLISRNADDTDFRKKWVFRHMPRDWGERTGGWLGEFVTGMDALHRPGLASKVVGVTMAIWLIETGFYWCLGQGFGLDLRFVDYVVVMMAPNLVRTLPLTPGDIGPFELVLAEVVALLGVSRGLAGTFAVGSHLFILGWYALMGLISVQLLGIQTSDILGEREEEKAPT
jgi:uncharacterized protein (TIRG00374 family)